MAPRYDTVGWLTRDGFTLLATASVGLAKRMETTPSRRVLVSHAINGAARKDAGHAVLAVVQALTARGAILPPVAIELPEPGELFEAFRVTQSAEAWRSHGAWVDAHPGALAKDVEARFAWARDVSSEREEEGLAAAAELTAVIDKALGYDVLVLPSTASAAPAVGAEFEALEVLREATIGMTAIAGLTGRPALSVPLAMTEDGPVGVCLVGPRGSDLALIELGLEWQAAL